MSVVTSILALHSAQLGMLVDIQGDIPGVHVEQLVVSFPMHLDADALQAAWSAIVAGHEALRSCFVTGSVAQPVVCVLGRVPARVDRVASMSDRKAWLAADRRRGFDIERPPLARLTLAPGTDEGIGNVLILTYSHLILDGWSVRLLIERLQRAYHRASEGLAPLPCPAERLALVRAHLASTEDTARAWLRTHLRDISRLTHPFLTSEARLPVEAETHHEVSRVINAACTNVLVAAARRYEVSLAMYVQAAWASILLRRTGATRAVYGVTATMRPPEVEGIEDAVGMLVGTIPVTVTSHASIAGLFAELRALSLHLAAVAHVDVSRVAAELGWAEGLRLCESVIVTQQGDMRTADSAEAAVLTDMAAHGARTGHALIILVSGVETLHFQMVGRSRHYDRQRLDGLLHDLLHVLFALAEAAPSDAPNRVVVGLPPQQWSAPPIISADRRALISGELPLRESLRRLWEGVTGQSVGTDGRLDRAATSSLALVTLKARIETWLGVELPLSGLIRCNNLDELVACVESGHV